ncbi:MAG: YtxH domain-containing protein [Hormoscilla sp. SP5CHS1]|nr:YtxH domain-containing protein [Hormoscilla sp. SP12CHS1]MBC6456135.1 YtxH domain-containing protein [Hormoscilla sp. SP5CHS1]
MSKNSSGKFIRGLLLGTVIGGVTGILMAPRSGRQTRQLLKKSAEALPELAEDISANVQIQADQLSEATLRNLEETLERLRLAIAVAIEAGAREQEALSQEYASDLEELSDDPNEQLPGDTPMCSGGGPERAQCE